MPDMDQGIKRLLQTHPQDFLALALPGAHYLRTDPIDLALEPPLVMDTLLRVRYRGVECLVDIEAEARPRQDIGRRLFRYAARAMEKTDLPVRSIVLWLERGGKAPTSPYETKIADLVVGTWNFIGIELYRLSTQDLVTLDVPGLLPLMPFTREGGDFDRFVETAYLVKDRAPTSDLVELEALLGVFATRRFDESRVLNVLEEVLMSTEIIGTSRLYQRWVREAKAEGKAEGEAEALHTALLTVLRGRFGALTPDLERAIAAASTEAITALLPAAGTASLDDLRTRLGL